MIKIRFLKTLHLFVAGRVVKTVCLFSIFCVFLSACTHHQMYDAIQQGNRMDCDKYDDETVRQQCMNNAAKSYDAYQRERKDQGE